MSEHEPFATRGAIPVVQACMELILETEELEGFDYGVALTEVRARTDRDDIPLDHVINRMRAATERLHAEGTPGVRNIGKGWQRLDPRGMVAYVAEREKRGRRQFRRAVTAIKATDRERLSFEDRHALDFHERAARAVTGLEARRARRQRPLLPGE